MIRPIVKDIFFLRQPSVPATKEDLQAGIDLLDTLKAHEKECVGMAANMIGIQKNIIAVNDRLINIVMFNPQIIKAFQPFEAEEGCLSLDGRRITTRYRRIELEYQDMQFKKHRQKYQGWTAEIIQHECDHLKGILI